MQDKTPEITDNQVIAITTAYVQGMGKGLTAGWSNSEIANPYSSEWGCDAAWRIGYNEGKKRARQEPLEEPEAVAVPDAQEAFELAYATEWHKSRHGDETVEQLAAEVKSWREGATYGDDLPRLRFGWEGYQWALAATTEAGAADGEKMLGPRQNHLPNCNDEACLECSSLIPDEWVSKTPAAAPVVLPETDAAVTEVMGLVQDYFVTGIDKARSTIETKLRALLATATGLPAQAVSVPTPQDSCCAWSVWWTHEKSKHTTTRQASIAGWDAGIAYALERAAPQAQADAREFPAMTPELASILGLMCFQCIPFAQALRAAGHQIKTRAEDEQAAVLHWMLGHWFRHGEEWRDHAQADMNRMKDAAVTAAKGE